MKSCGDPSCPRLLAEDGPRFCQKHMPRKRKSAAKRFYGRSWQRARRTHLQEHPLCLDPFKTHQPVIVAATIVDHALPHNENDELFWTQAFWGSLCAPCHSQKTTRIDPYITRREFVTCVSEAASTGAHVCVVVCQAVIKRQGRNLARQAMLSRKLRSEEEAQ